MTTKLNAPKICLANIDSRLHNGKQCKFSSKVNDGMAEIEVGGTKYTVKKRRRNNVDLNRVVKGSREQIPLKLNWACTVHKSQGSQLPKVVIHSESEFTGGMLYVAASRVKSYKDVQIKGFSKHHVKSRADEIKEMSTLRFKNFIDDISCCRSEVPPHSTCTENALSQEKVGDDPMGDEPWFLDATEEFLKDNVPIEEEDKVMHLEIVLEGLEELDHALDQPPSDFNYVEFLAEMKDTSILCNSQVSQNKNRVIDKALSVLPKTILFVKILWKTIFRWMKHHINENISDTTLTTLSAFLKDVVRKVWFITRDDNVRYLLMIVLSGDEQKATLEEEEIGFCSDLAMKIYNCTLEAISNSVRSKIVAEATESFKVKEMDNYGLAKIRYLAGYVTQELLKQAKKYVAENLQTEQQEVRNKVGKAMKKIKMLKENIIERYDKLKATTKYSETLTYVEQRQYSCNSLLHVTDNFYEFILALEQARANHLKMAHIQAWGDKFLFTVKEKMLNDPEFSLQHNFEEQFRTLGNVLHTANEEVCNFTITLIEIM